jgi:hypothetical protein
MLAASMCTNHFSWFVYFLTFWGVIVTFFSTIMSAKAASHNGYSPRDQKRLNDIAVASLECAHCLNLLITPLFWIILAPGIFPTLKWHGMDLFMRLHMTTLHSVPIITSTINIVLTDMKLVPEHWTRMVWMGVIYMFCNGFGTYMTGRSLYPIVDWKNIPLTVFLWILTAFIQAGLYRIAAYFINKLPRSFQGLPK